MDSSLKRAPLSLFLYLTYILPQAEDLGKKFKHWSLLTLSNSFPTVVVNAPEHKPFITSPRANKQKIRTNILLEVILTSQRAVRQNALARGFHIWFLWQQENRKYDQSSCIFHLKPPYKQEQQTIGKLGWDSSCTVFFTAIVSIAVSRTGCSVPLPLSYIFLQTEIRSWLKMSTEWQRQNQPVW